MNSFKPFIGFLMMSHNSFIGDKQIEQIEVRDGRGECQIEHPQHEVSELDLKVQDEP